MSKGKRLEGLLRDINQTLRDLTNRLERLEDNSGRVASSRPLCVPGTLNSLPEHLRRSMEAIATLGEATAEIVAGKSERSRAAESDYLNQLVDRGFLKKVRVGKEVVFRVFDLHTVCPMCGNRVVITARYCNLCGAALCQEEAPVIKRHGHA
jgi:hypothetical protein